MEALKTSTFTSLYRPLTSSTRNPKILTKKIILHFSSTHKTTPFLPSLQCRNAPNFRTFAAISPTAPSIEESLPLEPEIVTVKEEEKFDWYAHWYPVVPVADLDKRRPTGKKVVGLDIVIWWDKNDNEWKVFEDSCPHRLAPLSEGRIDQWGRLQCVYHGWCFGGAGYCKFIPQAPRDGPPIHTSKRACVAVYPSCVQNGIVWFWPNSDPEFKDIFSKTKPHYIPELDDPSYTNSLMCRDVPYGYEVLIENLMDPAHVPYAHYGILRTEKVPESMKADREGGMPLEISIEKLDMNGFTAKQVYGENRFVAPCLYYGHFALPTESTSSTKSKSWIVPPIPANKRLLTIFYCIPVSPGNSRLIFSSPRNFAVWVERIFPRWMFHIGLHLILDSDLYLLHREERKFKELGSFNWHKTCYVPTKSDTLVATFRRWLNKYGGTQVDWGTKFSGLLPLPPTPPREQLLDRYWSHTVNCSSCSAAYKGLNILETALQVLSVASIGMAVVYKQNSLAAAAVICFVASKWLSHFIYKYFRYHDYDHAFH